MEHTYCKSQRSILPFILMAALLLLGACKKGWLDQKPQGSLVLLSTIDDYQALLRNNALSLSSVPGILGEMGSDNVYIPLGRQGFFDEELSQCYIWGPELLYPSLSYFGGSDWYYAYTRIYTANSALYGLQEIDRDAGNGTAWDQAYGEGLFYRAWFYHTLAQGFVKAYDSTTASTDPGVPMRLVPSIAEKVGRGTAQQLYDQMIADLEQASKLLFDGPQTYSQYFSPTRAAAYALLARIYLSMGNYTKAWDNANRALGLRSTLLDYNTISPTGDVTKTMPAWYTNPEVIFFERYDSDPLAAPYNAGIDTTLYKSYDTLDLRRRLFFDTVTNADYIAFSGNYNGTSKEYQFSAVAVDEVYLIRAECYARQGKRTEALTDLNTLLENRWVKGRFTPLTASTDEAALRLVLTERRKELVMRGVRWSDLRRLNKDPRFQTTLTRVTADGQVHTLPPNSNLYVWPIPASETSVSGIAQNPR